MNEKGCLALPDLVVKAVGDAVPQVESVALDEQDLQVALGRLGQDVPQRLEETAQGLDAPGPTLPVGTPGDGQTN
jgi:hypothetical protein